MQEFTYTDERFADIQILRYRLNDFSSLSLKQKQLVYCLAEATLWGRDITFDQFGSHNLKIRKTLEAVYTKYKSTHADDEDFRQMTVYLKRVWFSSGIHHHYGQEKFVPGFSQDFFIKAVNDAEAALLPLDEGQTRDELTEELLSVIFDCGIQPKRVCLDKGVDQVKASACNYYVGVTQKEAESFYAGLNGQTPGDEKPSYGLNTTLVKEDGGLKEITWCLTGKYGGYIEKIIYWLDKAMQVAENDRQRNYIRLLIDYYTTGDLATFDRYSIEWLKEKEARVDFVNGFIEVYGDPLGIKGSWEGIVEYKDLKATERTRKICENAQWFEDHSPVDPRFRKKQVRGVTANVICAAMLGGDEYPASAIGINLPNADWIRARYGSKSVTIGNLTEAYNKAAKGNGFREEFVIDHDTIALINKYGDLCDDLHTDLHECLGHGSGQILPGVDAGALKSYGSTIEEARADLFGLYYIADPKLVELGLLPDPEAYKSQYYTYLLNGLLTQQVRIKPGAQIEEAHMRNRALIARWVAERSRGNVMLTKVEGKTYLKISDYESLRTLFAGLLAEIQRIKSEGDYGAAQKLVEDYGVRLDPRLHEEVLGRYRSLNIAPYKGFVNPVLEARKDAEGNITDIEVSYGESYTDQMLRYGRDYSMNS